MVPSLHIGTLKHCWISASQVVLIIHVLSNASDPGHAVQAYAKEIQVQEHHPALLQLKFRKALYAPFSTVWGA